VTWLQLVQGLAICVNLYCGWSMWREASRYRALLLELTQMHGRTQQHLDAAQVLLVEVQDASERPHDLAHRRRWVQ
jgi:hypothetical protein